MRTTRVLRSAVVLATCAIVVAACSGGGGEDPESGPAATGGTLTAQLTEPSALAPSQNCYESECSRVLRLIHEPLLTVDLDTGELAYDGLLKSVRSDDNTTWTLGIEPDRSFHNGEPVDADAFIRAWNWSADPANEADTTGFLSKIEGYGEGKELSGLRKVDDQTLRVTLSAPFALFPTTLSYGNAFYPMAQECLADVDACNESPIGTGPYRMRGVWEHSQGITVERWPGYRGEMTANPDTIDFQMTTDLVAAWRAFQAGQLDITRVDPTIFAEAQAQLGDRLLMSETGNLAYMGFPVTNAPFDEKLMRQAVSMAFDRQLIIDKVLNGIFEPSTGLVPPVIPGAQEDACGYCRYDPQRAKQLFARAGGRPGMTVDLWFNPGGGHDAWVQAIGNQLKQHLGVEYKLQTREWAQFLEILEDQAFTGPFRAGWLPDYPANENYLRPLLATGGDANFTGYSSERVDDLVTRGDRAASPEQAQRFYQQAEDAALEDMPILPLWVSKAPTAYSPEVDNVSYNIIDEVPLNEVTVD
jgi:oligopeptide transport system substrate-binding protein